MKDLTKTEGVSVPIFEDVQGAPFKIGTLVMVTGGTDSTFDETLKGKKGKITYFEYSCGCGQTYPSDPMIGVLLKGDKIEEFWKEELAQIRKIS